ncbi:MAG: NosD domain-containing protein, partial [Pseudomonadota bacterium]
MSRYDHFQGIRQPQGGSSTTNKFIRLIRLNLLGLVIALGLVASHLTVVMAEETLPATPGILEGTGISFALTDSDYLNVSVTSSAEIELYLNSAPMIIHMGIAASAGATSTDITLGGLEASTSYWMYQDGSVDGVEIASDANGSYSFTLDLTEARDIMIQPGQSTVYIYDDGSSGTGYQCTSVGTWDATSKTCTLTQDVNDSIYIYSTGVTLDGNDYQVNTPYWGSVQLQGSNHTVKNLTINGSVRNPTYCDLYGGSWCQPTGYGLYLRYTHSNTITNVTVINTYVGLYLYYSGKNTISKNIFSGVTYGAYQYHRSFSQYYCDLGNLYRCSANTLSDNTFSASDTNYDYYGVYLHYGTRNGTIRGNTISGFDYGLYLYDRYCLYGTGHRYCPADNTVYQNNFIDNYPYQIHAGYGYSNTVFNKAEPDGGNYYSNYDEATEGCGDADSDEFCDSPYAITSHYNAGIYDYLPWTIQDGWLNEAPVADANGPYLVA